MEKKKMSTKKKVLLVIVIVLLVALVGGIIFYLVKPDPGTNATLVEVTSGSITQTLDTSATVESANQGVFNILEGTEVLTVNVRVGDRFKAGDVLATFNAESIDKIIEEKEADYETARAANSDYLAGVKTASAQLDDIDSQISALEAKLGTGSGSDEIDEEIDEEDFFARLKSKLEDFFSFDQLKTILGNITGTSAISEFSSLLNGSGSDEIELLTLKAQRVLLETQSSSALKSTYASLETKALDSLEQTKATVELLKNGWVAENDGIVREVNITAGSVYTPPTGTATSSLDLSAIIGMLTSGTSVTDLLTGLFADSAIGGMTVEYYPFTASFVLGKYDVLKVSMDQEVTVTSANGKTFDGKIIYISPVASSSSSISINSLLGSGGSSAGIDAKISILNPDESVIIGIDVEVSIDIASADDAIVIPIEALQYDSEGTYVFIYDAETSTVKKSAVETGLYDGISYQIVSGCSVGDKIIRNPPQSMLDGEKINVIGEAEITTATAK